MRAEKGTFSVAIICEYVSFRPQFLMAVRAARTVDPETIQNVVRRKRVTGPLPRTEGSRQGRSGKTFSDAYIADGIFRPSCGISATNKPLKLRICFGEDTTAKTS
jgi:hypothetical protein